MRLIERIEREVREEILKSLYRNSLVQEFLNLREVCKPRRVKTIDLPESMFQYLIHDLIIKPDNYIALF